MKYVFSIILFFLFLNISAQQTDTIPTSDEHVKIIGSDTIFIGKVDPIYFYYPSAKNNISKKERNKNLRLIYNVKKAYYYAKLANEKLKQVDEELLKIKGKKERKEYLDKAEKDLRAQFEEELKKLTITQGRILVKLIDRETGNTTFYLVKEMRGTFSAYFWQSVARLFGSNLKSKYDPLGEDKDIEAIIQMIDKGLL